jgi:protein-tyrosine phosphatase
MINRSHPVTKLANLRDLGGVPSQHGVLRYGQLFRSDDVATIDDEQVSDLMGLNLGLIIDFRSKAEVDAIGRGPLSREEVDYLHLPLLDYIGEDHNVGQEILTKELTNEMLGGWYADVLHKAAPMIADGLSAISEHPGPALFHCAIGKDRTGIFASAFYSLMGVSSGHIVADYVMTDENLPEILARLEHSQPFWNEETMRASGALMRAQPAAMETMLDVVGKKSGSVTQVLEAAGLDSGVMAGLIAKHHN